jgi:CRISPR/Cas system CSM-associated protein Csm2 small subunit
LSNCEAKKAIFPEGRIVYSTTSPTNNNVTAYVLDIKPYGTIIQNNGWEASKVFQKNWSFTFSLKFDDKISYLTATVDWINTRPITLADLSYDYQSRKCKENRTFVLPTSTKYNLLNMQTMLNNCIFQNMISKWWKITVRGTNNLSYKAFIESLYYFVKTIRKYDTMPTARNDSIKYKNLPRTKDFKYIVWWFNAIWWRRHINHKSSKNVIDIQWNKPVTPKEVYNTIYSILQNHEDTASHRKSLWEQSEITNKKSISYNDYASLIRRLLEAYDRVPIGINDSLMYSIYQKVKDQNIEEQKKSISNIMLSLKKIAPDKAEKQGLSLLRILEDLSAVYNNTIPKRKWVMTISLDKVQQRVWGNNNSSKINTLDMNIDSLFSKMSY